MKNQIKWTAIILITFTALMGMIFKYGIKFEPTNKPNTLDTIKQIVVIDTITSGDIKVENPAAYIVEWTAVKLSYFHQGNTWLAYDEKKSKIFLSRNEALKFRTHLTELAKQRNELVRFDGKLKIKTTKVK